MKFEDEADFADARHVAFDDGSDPSVDEDDLDPRPEWARVPPGIGGYFTFLLRLGFFGCMPFVAVLLAIFSEQRFLLAMILAAILLCGLLRPLRQMLDRWPVLGRIPLVGDALRAMNRLHEFYFEHRPYWFVTYLLAPFIWPVMLLVSSRARQEFSLYWGVFLTIVAGIALETWLAYQHEYPPHLGVADAAGAFGARVVFAGFVLLVFFLPTVTTNIGYSLQGIAWPRRMLAILSLASAIPAFVFYYAVERSPVSFMGTHLLEARFQKPAFRQDLEQSVRMFLGFHIPRAPEPGEAVTALEVDAELSTRLQHTLDGYLTQSEMNGFTVIRVPMKSEPDGRPWYAVRVRRFNHPAFLYAVSKPDGTPILNWKDLPAEFTDQFHPKPAKAQIAEIASRLEIIEDQTLGAPHLEK